MEARHNLRLALGDVERRTVGLRQAGDEIDQEQGQQRQPEPGEKAACLSHDDIPQVQAAGGDQDPDQGKTHGNLVGDDLGAGAQGAKQGVLGVGSPARDDDTVDAQGGQGQDVEETGVDVRQDQTLVEGKDRPGGQGRGQGQQGGDDEEGLIRPSGQDDLLEHQLERISDRLEQPTGPHPVRANADLHVADDLALGQGVVSHQAHERGEDHHDLHQDPDHLRQGIPELNHGSLRPHALAMDRGPIWTPRCSLPATAAGMRAQPRGTVALRLTWVRTLASP